MIKELILHTGFCKTGSTSIQSYLAKQSYTLDGHSICYPAAFNHIVLAKSVSNPDATAARAGHFKTVQGRFDASDADAGIISAEHFEFTDPHAAAAAIKTLLPEYWENMRVITYIRPHAERLLSSFAERVKSSGRLNKIEDLQGRIEQSGLLHYTPKLREWREAFGDRFFVRPMIRGTLKDGDVVRDFFDFIFPNAAVDLQEMTDSNTSLSVEDLVYLREIHRLIRRGNRELDNPQTSFGWNFADMLRANQRGRATKLRMHRSVAQKIQEVYAEDAAHIDREFLGGATSMTDALAASVEKAVEEPISLKLRDYYSARAIGHIHAHAELLQRMMESKEGRFTQMVRRPELQSKSRQSTT